MGQYEQAMKNMAQPIQKMYQGGQVQGFHGGGGSSFPSVGRKLINGVYVSHPNHSYPSKNGNKYSSAALANQADAAFDAAQAAAANGTNGDGANGSGDDSATVQPKPYYDTIRPMGVEAIKQTLQPTQAPVNYIQPMAADFIGSTAGQTAPIAPMAEAATAANVTQSNMATTSDAGQITDTKTELQVLVQN